MNKTLTLNALDLTLQPHVGKLTDIQEKHSVCRHTYHTITFVAKILKDTLQANPTVRTFCRLNEFSQAPKNGGETYRDLWLLARTHAQPNSAGNRRNSWSRQLCLEVRRVEMHYSFVGI